jgi:uncharacterized membrane protein
MNPQPISAAPAGRATALRIGMLCLLAHASASVLSGVAFSTFLAPPVPSWMSTPENREIATFLVRWGGQSTVVLGALAGVLHAASRIGQRRAWLLFAVAFSITLAAELLGTGTGYPFGPYTYTSQLGYLIAGLVPFNIPTSWFYMLYASLAICGRLLPATDDGRTRWWWALVAAFVLTAWDVSMDPAMVRTNHWFWHVPPSTIDGSPLVRVLGAPFYFGMPLTNWLGWLLTGFLVARVMLWVVPPSTWARDVAPSNVPLVLYAVNGVLPIAICFSHDMALAGILGTIAMAVPLAAALLARLRAGASWARPVTASMRTG